MKGKFNNSAESFFISGDSDFVSHKFDYSTADIEASIFFGDSSDETIPEREENQDIKGTFRLIDGNLFEMVNLAPPNSIPLQKTSGLFKLAGF